METLDTKFLVVLGILIWLKQANAINCYSCDILEDKCLDPFKASGVSTISCSRSCYKMKAKDSKSGLHASRRGCTLALSAEDKCIEATESGITGTVCVCNGNLCNYALPVGSSVILTAASIIIYIALH